MKMFFVFFTVFLCNSYAFSFGFEGVQSLYKKGFGLQISVKSREGLVFKKGQKIYALRGKERKAPLRNYRHQNHYTTTQCELHLKEAPQSNQILKKNRKINLVDLTVSDQPYYIGRERNGDRPMTRSWEFDVSSDDESFAKLIVKKSQDCWVVCDDRQTRFVETDLTISTIVNLCSIFNVKKVKLNYGNSL